MCSVMEAMVTESEPPGGGVLVRAGQAVPVLRLISVARCL